MHERIDAVLAKTQVGPPAPLSGDAEFLRRVFLDLTGRIPSSDETRKFLDDESPDKRRRLIDELLQSPACDRHLAKIFDVMLMQRRRDNHVKGDKWDAYLLESIKENKPYDRLAREILSADGVDPEKRARVKFYLDREDMAVNLVTRDTGRIFFGRDIECAQCHDHPLISDYEQSEYHGLLAFFDRSSVFQPNKKKPAVLAEKAGVPVKFKSVFTGYEGETLPRLPGEEEISEPKFKKGEEYKVKPKKNVRPVPKYSRREKFAELATDGTNEAFNKNIANRLWAVMLGRGVVEPVDLHHPENPPASPEFLKLLTEEFVAMEFDIKAFLQQIALSDTYQRSFRLPESFEENLRIARRELPQRKAEKADYEDVIESSFDQVDKLEAQEDRLSEKAELLEKKAEVASKKLAALEKTHQEAEAALKKLSEPLVAKRDTANLLKEAAKQAALAAEKLPGDQALAQASSAIAAQSEAQEKQLAALKKPYEQQAQAVEKAEKELAEAKAESKQIGSERAELESAIEKTDAQIQSVLEQREAAYDASADLEREIKRLSLLTGYADADERFKATVSKLKSLETQLAAAQAEAAQKADALAKSQEQQSALKKTHEQTKKTLSAKKKELANHTQAGQMVEKALAQIQEAQKQLSDETELAEVAAELESARDSQADRTSAVKQEIQEQEKSLKQADAKLADLEQGITDLSAAVESSRGEAKKLAARRKTFQAELVKAEGDFEKAEADLTKSWTKYFSVAGVEHLSPEQLAWSVLEAVGQVKLQEDAARAAWNKKHPDLAKKELTPKQQAERNEFVEQTMRSKLEGQVKKFLPLFAASSGQPQHEFFATVDQALFFSNGNEVQSWLRPRGENLTGRLSQLAEPKQIAEELYLSVLTRRPTAAEIQDVADYLAQRKGDKAEALQELAWALLTSAEFRFLH